MKEYFVTFTQYHCYTVEAENEEEAEQKAYKEFQSDMRSPIAQTWYDDCDIDEVENKE